MHNLTNCRKSIYALLAPLKLYSLTQGSLICCELEAYCEGLRHLEDRIKALFADRFIETAGETAISRWERILNMQRAADIPIWKKRETIIYLISTSPDDFYPSGMVNSVRAAGMEAEIIEHIGQDMITLKVLDYIGGFENLDLVKQNALAMLPAHLEVIFDVGIMTWDMFDQKNYSFDNYDGIGFSWEQFDLDGATL